MRTIFVAAVFVFVVLFSGACSAQIVSDGSYQDSADARVFIDAAMPPSQLADQFQKLPPRWSNIPELSKLNGEYVFGRNWVQLTPEQQHKFFSYLNGMSFRKYDADYHFRAPGSYPETDNETVIRSQILYSQTALPTEVDWLVRRHDDGSLTIIDVAIDGVSQNPDHRDDFTPILMHGGGSLDGLMDAMRAPEISGQD